MNKILELREKYNLTRKQLSLLTGIPMKTIQSWELETRVAPDYIYNLIENTLEGRVIATPNKTILTPSKSVFDITASDVNQILKKEFYSLTLEDVKKLNTAYVNQMKEERARKERGGIYGITQRLLAYNSSKIEGNRLTEDETRYLFELNQLPEGEYRTKDIEEMTGHFVMFNYALNNIDTPLSEDLIKTYHKELQSGVFEFRANGGIAGEYKHKQNIVGKILTSSPKEVHTDMVNLIKSYNEWIDMDNSSLEPLVKLHAEYERIHPFQDGNGRTGRMLLFTESLNQNRIPFIIPDDKKIAYYEALKHAQGQPDNIQGEYITKDQLITPDYAPLASFFKDSQLNFYTMLQQYMYDHSIDLDTLDSTEEHNLDDL